VACGRFTLLVCSGASGGGRGIACWCSTARGAAGGGVGRVLTDGEAQGRRLSRVLSLEGDAEGESFRAGGICRSSEVGAEGVVVCGGVSVLNLASRCGWGGVAGL